MKQAFALPVLATLLGNAPLHAADGTIALTVGADYSSGKYGDTVATEMWAYPVMLKYETGAFTWKASIPYIRTSGPSNVVGTGSDRVVTAQSQGVTRSESGWGDAVTAVAWSFYQNAADREGLDLIGKIKFATGDTAKGLSTGKNDYALQMDGYKAFGRVTALASLGRKFMGDPSGVSYRDPWYASLGAAYKLSPTNSLGGTFDWREKLTASGAQVREAMLFLSHRLDSEFKLQVYLVKGFSDASPDQEGGMMLGYQF